MGDVVRFTPPSQRSLSVSKLVRAHDDIDEAIFRLEQRLIDVGCDLQRQEERPAAHVVELPPLSSPTAVDRQLAEMTERYRESEQAAERHADRWLFWAAGFASGLLFAGLIA